MLLRHTRVFGVLAAVAFAAGAYLVPSIAQAVDYSGKKVTVMVPFKEGGGSDTVARLFQPYLQQYLPGNPTVIVRNKPGGSSVKGSNDFERRAKKDGTTVMVISTSTLVAYVIGGKKVKYDVLKWRPIFSTPQDTVFYARPETGVKGKDIVADIKALRSFKGKDNKGLMFGAKNPTSAELRALITFEMLGIDVKTVFGLSSGKQRKALRRGEIHINYDSASAYNKKVRNYVKKGDAVPLMTLGYPLPDGTIIKSSEYPDMPTVLEAYQKLNGKMPSGPSFEAWKNFANMGVAASKGMVLPRGTPDDVRDAWVKAVKSIYNDEKFKKRATKILGSYPPQFGDDAAKVYKNATDMKPKVKEWLKAWIGNKFNVTL